MNEMPAQVSRLHEVADTLTSGVGYGWDEEERPALRTLGNMVGAKPVSLYLRPDDNGIAVQVTVGPSGGRPPVTEWLGVVSHRLGEGYAEDLIEAMVASYVRGLDG